MSTSIAATESQRKKRHTGTEKSQRRKHRSSKVTSRSAQSCDASTTVCEFAQMICRNNQACLLYAFDNRGNIHSVSEAFVLRIGYQQQQIVGAKLTLFLSVQDAQRQSSAVHHIGKESLESPIISVESRDGTILKFTCTTLKVPKSGDNTTTDEYYFVSVLTDAPQQTVPESNLTDKLLLLPRSLRKPLNRLQIVSNMGDPNAAQSYVEHYNATVGFIEVRKFVNKTATWPIDDACGALRRLYEFFDQTCTKYKMYAKQGSGLRYMFFSRNTQHAEAHAINAVLFATECHRGVQNLKLNCRDGSLLDVRLRIGIATGKIVSSLFFTKKKRVTFCVWGKTVNAASTITSLAPSGGTLVTQKTYKMAKYYERLFFEGPVVNTKINGYDKIKMYSVWHSGTPQKKHLAKESEDDDDDDGSSKQSKEADDDNSFAVGKNESHCAAKQDPLPQFTVLIVDDVNVNNTLLAEMLLPYECNVIACNSAKEVLEMFAKKNLKIDLCICDVLMPEMDGIALTKRLRQDYDCNALPIIGLTGLHQLESLQKCQDAGMNDVLYKPLDPARLHTMLSDWLLKGLASRAILCD